MAGQGPRPTEGAETRQAGRNERLSLSKGTVQGRLLIRLLIGSQVTNRVTNLFDPPHGAATKEPARRPAAAKNGWPHKTEEIRG